MKISQNELRLKVQKQLALEKFVFEGLSLLEIARDVDLTVEIIALWIEEGNWQKKRYEVAAEIWSRVNLQLANYTESILRKQVQTRGKSPEKVLPILSSIVSIYEFLKDNTLPPFTMGKGKKSSLRGTLEKFIDKLLGHVGLTIIRKSYQTSKNTKSSKRKY